MKKIITALLAAVFAFSFCACDTSSDNTENSDSFPARIPAWSADEPSTAAETQPETQPDTKSLTSAAKSRTDGPGYKVEPTNPDFADSDFGYYMLSSNEVMVTEYYGNSKSVVIPDTVSGNKVVAVGKGLFRNSGIESVVIPDTVSEIQDYAFSCCSELKEIVIPEGVTVVGRNTFWNCPKLEKIVIPASLREAGEYAFSHTGVKSVTIPEGAALTTLESCLFFQCFDLEEVILPASIRFINDGAFKECSPKLTIKAPAGSCGEAYAKDNGITFEELSR